MRKFAYLFHGYVLLILILAFMSFGFTPKGYDKSKNDNLLETVPQVEMTTVTQNDAGLLSGFIDPSTSVGLGTQTALKVILKNHGQLALTSVQIPYSINGVIADTFLWSGSLTYAQTDTVIIDSLTLIGGLYSIEAYTQLPNNTQDTVNTNDTVSINMSVCMSGVYTIGDTINGTADFGSFQGALAALNSSGICGNVVFNVEIGTYSEQLNINSISGSSINNQITFQSANANNLGVVLQYNSGTSSSNHTIHFNGCSFVKFKNMTIKSLSLDSCKTIIIDGGADHIVIENNIISIPALTNSNSYGIYSGGDNDNNITITGNHILNGEYGIYMKGISITNKEVGLVIENNILDDFFAYGISTYYQEYSIISNNELNADDDANHCEGIHVESSYNWFFVKNNRINIIGGGYSLVQQKYGIRIKYSNVPQYITSYAGPGYVYNNMIVLSGNNYTRIGIEAYDNDNVKYYYNSVNIIGGGNQSKALSQHNNVSSSFGAGQDFINNIFVNLTSGGYAAEFNSVNTIGIVDHNVYYVPSNSGNLVYWLGNKNTIESLQLASGQNNHSLKVLPQFQSATDLHLVDYQLLGTGVPLPNVLTDFDGEARCSVASVIGVDEIPRLNTDIGVIDLIGFPNILVESYSYPINVRIRNEGVDTLHSFVINYHVNNGALVSYNYSGSLAPLQYDTVSLTPLTTLPIVDTICVNVVAANDSNNLNNEICQGFYGVVHKDAAISKIIKINSSCGLGLDTISVWVKNMGIDTINDIGQQGQVLIKYKNGLGVGATVVSENFDSLIYPGDSLLYSFYTLADFTNNSLLDSLYFIKAWIAYPGDGVASNDTVTTIVNSLSTIVAPTFVSPLNVPYASSVNINVGSPNTVFWYESDTTVDYFKKGLSYTTPVMFENDTFWLQAQPNDAIFRLTETVQFKDALPTYIVYPSYFPSTDFDGIEISNVSKMMGNLSGYEINVYMNNSAKISYVFPSGTLVDSGAVICAIYGSGLVMGPQGNGVINIGSLSTIYSASQVCYWLKDQEGNIIDAFASNGATFPAYSGVTSSDFSGQLNGGSGHIGSVRWISDNNSASDWNLISPSNFSFGNYNTVLPLEGGGGCIDPRAQMIVNVGNQQSVDVSVSEIITPISLINLSATEKVKVRVINYGFSNQDSIPIGYQINNGIIVWDTIYSSIAVNDSLEFDFSIGADLSTPNSVYSIKVFTACVNDTNYANDTLIKSVANQNTNYCYSGSSNAVGVNITNVTVYQWSHSSPNISSSYTDFTSLVPYPMVNKGISNPISIVSDNTGPVGSGFSCYTNVFIDFNRDGQFTFDERVFGGSTMAIGFINGYFTVPDSVYSGLTNMRVVMKVNGNANNTGPCGVYSSGETEDYAIYIADRLPEDVALDSILIPAFTSVANNDLKIRVVNHGVNILDSLDVTYSLNGGNPITTSFNSLAVNSLDSVVLNLGQINLQSGENTIWVYSSLPLDTNTFNDTIHTKRYLQSAIIPDYTDDFEGNSIWLGNTFNNTHWTLGSGLTYTAGTHSPVNAWVYSYASWGGGHLKESLYTPHFITAGQDSARINFWHYLDHFYSVNKVRVEYSLDNGPWRVLGRYNDSHGTNWYNLSSKEGWGLDFYWQESSYTLDLTDTIFNHPDMIQFRFITNVHTTDYISTEWVIDDFSFALLKLPQDAGIIAITTPDTSINTGANMDVSVDVKNFGSSSLFSIPVSYTIGSNTVNDTLIIAPPGLLPDDTVSFTFANGFIAPNLPNSLIQICAKTNLNDLNTANDEVCKQLSVEPPLVEIKLVDFKVNPSWHDTTKTSFDNTVQIYVVNMGVDTLTDINFIYSSTSTTVAGNETWVGSLASYDTLIYSFVDTYKSPTGSYLVCAKALTVGDYDLGNNEACNSFFGIDNVGFDNAIIDGFSMKQNQPNPAYGKIKVYYTIPKYDKVSFEIRNVLGQMILNKEYYGETGWNVIEFNANKLESGVYYYSIIYNKQQITKKMIVQ